MGNNDNLDLDNELAKSIEKLVDEETSVAKAFVDRTVIKHDDDVRTDRNRNNTVSDNVTYVDSKTQAIPHIPSRSINLDDDEYDIHIERSVTQNKNVRDSRDLDRNASDRRPSGQNQKRNNKKSAASKNRLMVVSAVSVVILALLIIIIVSLVSSNNKNNSYSFNYSKGIEYYNNKEYSHAITYLEKAVATDSGKKDVDVRLKLYECYVVTNKMEKSVEALKDTLSYDKYNEKAIVALSEYYSEKKDGEKLTELIKKYRGTEGEKYLLKYAVNAPKASQAGGSYNGTIELQLNADSGNKIYYTSDGTEPTTKNSLYSDVIKIEKGNTTIKTVAVNSIGTYSEVVELKYVIDYKVPGAPDITPATGSYSAGQMIQITNLNEGDKAYYTLDGTTPTKASTEYTGSFAMLEGNTVVSVIIISEHELESSVTRRNYNVSTSKTYSFDEAVELLKVKMKLKQELNMDGNSADGGVATFVYQKKITIANVDMYYIRYDSKKSGVTSTLGYFGVGLKGGQCYHVTDNNGTYIAAEY